MITRPLGNTHRWNKEIRRTLAVATKLAYLSGFARISRTERDRRLLADATADTVVPNGGSSYSARSVSGERQSVGPTSKKQQLLVRA